MSFLRHWLLLALIFTLVDSLWIKFVANKFYKSQIGPLLRVKPLFLPAIIFYFLYITGMVVFALNPALDSGSIVQALTYGLLLGLVMYATYDLTNHATLKNWPVKMTIVDMSWGTIATATSVILGFLILN